MWYAVVGSLWNSMGIGLSLYAICQIQPFGVQDINLQENLLFATIISAVDPVAVLNVFQDISVNEQLYIVIFGEGLFNDAVIVVSVCVRVCVWEVRRTHPHLSLTLTCMFPWPQCWGDEHTLT